MNPVGSAFVPGPGIPSAPPQNEACSTFKKDSDNELYSEIPYQTFQSAGEQDAAHVDQPQPEHRNIPSRSAEITLQLHHGDEAEKEDLSTLSDNSVQEVYGN